MIPEVEKEEGSDEETKQEAVPTSEHVEDKSEKPEQESKSEKQE